MALREILAKFGVEFDDSGAKKAKDSIESVKETFKQVGEALAVREVFNGAKEFIGGLVEAGDQITDMSTQLGVSRGEFQAWSAAAGLGGASAEDFAASVKILEKNVGDVGKTADFKKLGLDLKQLQTLTPTEQLRAVGVAIAETVPEAEQARTYLELLGKGGLKLRGVFKDGSAATDELLDRMRALGIDEGTLDQLDAVGDSAFLLEKQWLKTKASLAAFALPWISEALGGLQKFVAMIGGSERAAHLFRSALIVLGAIVAFLAVDLLLPWLPFIALALAAIAVVDQLTAAFEGQPSLLGDIGQAASDAAKTIEQDFTDAGNAIGSGFRSAGRWVADFFKSSGKWFSTQGGAAVKWLNGLWAGVTSWFSGKIAEFRQFGADLVNGIVDGVTGAGNAIIDAIKAPVQAALDSIDELVGHHSPARWGVDFGSDLIAGMVVGAKQAGPSYASANEGVVSDALPNTPKLFAPELSGLGSAVDRSVAVHQTNQNTFHVQAALPALRTAVASGVGDASSVDLDALLGALEATA